MYGKMKLFARKKAENNDGFFFFNSLFHSSSILDMLFFVRFWFSGSGISWAFIAVCEKVKNWSDMSKFILYHSTNTWQRHLCAGHKIYWISKERHDLDYPRKSSRVIFACKWVLESVKSKAQKILNGFDHKLTDNWATLTSLGHFIWISRDFGFARGSYLQRTIEPRSWKFNMDYIIWSLWWGSVLDFYGPFHM